MDANVQDAIDYRLDMDIIKEYKLTAYKIVKLQWTEEKENPGNHGNGLHERYFICGTTQKDPEWRIYEFGFM